MLRTLKRALAVAPVALALAGATVVATGSAAQAAANPGPGFPAHFSAPYVETWNSPQAMTNVRNATGQKYFTLAFVIDAGNSCNAEFNGDTPVTDASWTSAVNAVRAAGGDVMASFGGASGNEPAVDCTSVSALKTQYKKVIDALNLTRVDFDIEAAVGNTAANTRRSQAVAQLQQEYAAAGKRLDVQYTLGVDTTGLPNGQMNLLRDAHANGVNVSLVNIMTMDYGRAISDMGQAAIDAATALHGQLGSIWTDKSDAQLWAMEGNTPMIGINDTRSDVFSTSNATAVVNFAKSKGIQELAFWALGRDKQCGGSNTDDSNNCSGVSQSAWQFSSILGGITGGGTTTPPPTGGATGQITGIAGKCVDVNAASTANGTAVQLYDCNGTGAQQWTVGSDGTLKALGKCMDVTAAGTADGTKVQLYDCNGSAAQKWTKGSGNTLVNQGSGKCLDASDNSSANLTRLQIWQCFGGSNQQWHLPA